ncbi:MAG: protein kinase, partial [Candidatus Eremiobacterota bacterium]
MEQGLQVGDVLEDKFEVKAHVGEGGMGTVFRVRHWDWNVDMAVKSPHPGLVAEAEARKRWILEAHTWVDLGVHPNIVRCWFVREWKGIPLLFLDYLPGGSLRDLIHSGNLTPRHTERILDLMIQATDGLAHAHQHGMIHRDVKPANMLLTADGTLSVTDFGLVKIKKEEALEKPLPIQVPAGLIADPGTSLSLTATGSVMGTPAYAAPEQWLGIDTLGPPTDVYALGVVLFEMCAGRRPFESESGHSVNKLLTGHVMEAPPDPRGLNSELSPALAELILRCLAKEVGDRPASMPALREELCRIYRDTQGTAYPRPPARASDERADALNNKAVSLWNLGMSQEAFDGWREASRLDAVHPESVYNRSVLQYRLGQVDADEVLRRLRQVKATHRRAAAFLGAFHLERFSPTEALRELEEATGLPDCGKDAAVWRALGDVRLSLEKFAEAEQAYRTALELSPEDRTTRMRHSMATAGRRSDDSGHCLFPLSRPCRTLNRPFTALTFLEDGLLAAGAEGVSRWRLEGSEPVWSQASASERPFPRLTVAGDLVVGLEAPPGQAWRLDDGTPATTLAAGDRIYAVRGNEAVAGLIDLSVVLLPTGQRLRTLRGHMSQVNSVTISPDGTRALSGGCDRTARFWDLVGARSLHVLTGHRDYVDAVAFTPDGNVGLTASRDRTVRMWLLTSGECVGVLQEVPPDVRHLALTADGKVLVAWGSDTATAWDLSSRTRLFSRPGPACLVPGSLHLLAGSPPSLWEIPSGRCLRTLGAASGTVRALAASSDGRWAAWSDDSSTTVWELDESARLYDRSLLVTRTRSHTEAESAREQFAAHLSEASRLAEGGQPERAYAELVQARAVPGYDCDPGALALNASLGAHMERTALKSAWETRSFTEPSASPIAAVAISQEGRWAVSAAGKLVRLWDLSTGSCVRGFTGHTERVNAVTLSGDGNWLVSAGQDGTVRHWSTRTGDCTQVAGRAGDPLVALGMAVDRAVTLSASGRLSTWDLATGDCRLTVDTQATALAAAGEVALTGGEGQLAVWDLGTGRSTRRWASRGRVTALAVDGSGRVGLSAAEGGRVTLW